MRAVYTPPFKPFEHQQEALDKMEGEEAFALLMEMRTGKTKTLLDDFGRLELTGQCQDLLVIAPGGVYRTWEGACREHFSADLNNRVEIFVWQSGGNATYKKALAKFLAVRDRPRVLLMNVEALSSVKEAREVALAFLKARRAMCAVDESTIIKNPASKRTKFINRDIASEADYRRILSGLPTPKDPLDIYAQMEFLDWRILGYRSFFAFRGRYAIMRGIPVGGRVVQLVQGFRDLDDLHEKVARKSHRVLFKDCYDMPPKIYSIREVKLTPEQERMYAEMKKYSVALIEGTDHVSATVVVAQMTRLHQILCGHTVDEDGTEHAIPENRTAEMLALLEEYTGKAIIWCSYDHDINKVSEALRQEYGPDSVARFWGGNIKTREEEEARFKERPECRFMVATASAGGRGRMWAVADLIMYYSNTNNLEHRSQSEERGQAIGKDRSVAYYDLVVPNTVDMSYLKAIREKIDLSSAVTGDNYREWLL